MELKNQIVEMDALLKSPTIGIQKIQKEDWNLKMLKLIEIPLPKLKFKKNCPWELKSINTVLIFILECWDLKTCEYVFDVETCKQKVAQGTIFCCLFCLSTAIYLYSWKKCSRIKHDQSNACLTKHKRYEQNPTKWRSKSIFKINIETYKKNQYF